VTSPTPDCIADELARRSAHDLQRLRRFIQQPSISSDGSGIDAMAELVASEIRDLGGEASVVPGLDFPIVYGRFDEGAERTVLIHGMYDTVSADGTGWISPPFDAAIVDLDGLGECLVGRGAEDTKGPLAATLSMIAVHRRAGL